MRFVRSHKTVAAAAILTLAFLIYLTLVAVGAIPAMVFPVYLGLVALGAAPALTFPIYYAAKAKWWRLASGEERETAGHVEMFSTLFGLLYVRAGINLSTPAGRAAVIHQSPAAAEFLMFLAVFAMAAVWHRVWLFHKGRKKQSAPTGERGQSL